MNKASSQVVFPFTKNCSHCKYIVPIHGNVLLCNTLLQEDMEENEMVYQCIYTLLSNNAQCAVQQIPTLLPMMVGTWAQRLSFSDSSHIHEMKQYIYIPLE